MEHKGPRFRNQKYASTTSNVKEKNRLPINSIHNGTVLKIHPSLGAFVAIDGSIDGLIYHDKLKHHNIHPKENDSIKVRVHDYNRAGKMSLEPVPGATLITSKEETETIQKKDYDQKTEAEQPEWKIGDYCRAWYSEDQQEYEAEIENIGENDPENGLWVTIKFVGYNNCENVWIKDIVKSHGEQSRMNQIYDAQNYVPSDETKELNNLEKNLEIQESVIEVIVATNEVDLFSQEDNHEANMQRSNSGNENNNQNIAINPGYDKMVTKEAKDELVGPEGDHAASPPNTVSELQYLTPKSINSITEKSSTLHVSPNHKGYSTTLSKAENYIDEGRRKIDEYIQQKIDHLKQQIEDLQCYATSQREGTESESSNDSANSKQTITYKSTLSNLTNLDDHSSEASTETHDIESKSNSEELRTTTRKHLATIEEEKSGEMEEDVAVLEVGTNSSKAENNVFEKFIEEHPDLISTIVDFPSATLTNDSLVQATQTKRYEEIETTDSKPDGDQKIEIMGGSIKNLLDCSPLDLDKAIGLPPINIHEVPEDDNVTSRLKNDACSEERLIKISDSTQDKKENVLFRLEEEANDSIAKDAFRFVFSKMLSQSVNIEYLVEDMFTQWKHR